MQFFVLAYEATDEAALARRANVRDDHIALRDRMIHAGLHLLAVTLLNDAGVTIGAAMICEFPSRAAIQEWLIVEPYVVGNVWHNIDVRPCRIDGPFTSLINNQPRHNGHPPGHSS